MTYSEQEARELVIEAGHRLIEKKLIARTWGNISARISDEAFVITPSGRAYETLRPEDLVTVRIADCSYEGEVKPSSEKGIHAAAYALRPEVGFIIHTHQFYASAVCAEGRDTDAAPCAAYGLPGTGRLKKAVAAAIAAHPDRTAFLMARHGAVCLGGTCEEAFAAAERLEADCEKLYEARAAEGKNAGETRPWLDDYAQLIGRGRKAGEAEDAEAIEMIREKNRAAARYVRTGRPLGFLDASLQRLVYLKKYSKLKNQ